LIQTSGEMQFVGKPVVVDFASREAEPNLLGKRIDLGRNSRARPLVLNGDPRC
jgi:hypothetical protein